MVDGCSEKCGTRCVIKIAVAIIGPIYIVFKQTIWLLHPSVSKMKRVFGSMDDGLRT